MVIYHVHGLHSLTCYLLKNLSLHKSQVLLPEICLEGPSFKKKIEVPVQQNLPNPSPEYFPDQPQFASGDFHVISYSSETVRGALSFHCFRQILVGEMQEHDQVL